MSLSKKILKYGKAIFYSNSKIYIFIFGGFRVNGGNTALLSSETGPVLVSWPNHFEFNDSSDRTIYVFHIGEYINNETDTMKTIKIAQRSGVEGKGTIYL